MDAKEIRLVSEIHGRLITRSFDERDVFALLILLRPHAPAKSPVRELSDFMAHREKDRGGLKKYVQHVVDYTEALVTHRSAQLKIDVVHTREAFRNSLNETLSKYGLAHLDPALADDVLVCVMSLLQDVRLFHTSRQIGHFVLTRLERELYLSAVVHAYGPNRVPIVFPALGVPNTYTDHPKCSGLGNFSGLVEARCAEGKLRLYIDCEEAA